MSAVDIAAEMAAGAEQARRDRLTAAVSDRLREADRQRAARLAALERFALDTATALRHPDPDLDTAQRLARIRRALGELTRSTS